MANPTGAFGFAPVGSLDGAPYSGATQRCYITATGATAVFVGDVVKMSGTASADGYPTVVLTAATDAPYGVVVGCEAIKTNLNAGNYRPASTAAYLRVVPVENALFKARFTAGAAAGIAAVGSCTIYTVAAGSTVTGLSGITLSTSDLSQATLVDEIRVLAMVDSADNDPTLASSVAIVMFNDSQTKLGAAGV